MGKTKLTKKNFGEVVKAILSGDYDLDDQSTILAETLSVLETLVEIDVKASPSIVKAMDKMLDNLVSQDFFGTEGQNDPRGDQRD